MMMMMLLRLLLRMIRTAILLLLLLLGMMMTILLHRVLLLLRKRIVWRLNHGSCWNMNRNDHTRPNTVWNDDLYRISRRRMNHHSSVGSQDRRNLNLDRDVTLGWRKVWTLLLWWWCTVGTGGKKCVLGRREWSWRNGKSGSLRSGGQVRVVGGRRRCERCKVDSTFADWLRFLGCRFLVLGGLRLIFRLCFICLLCFRNLLGL